MTIELNEARVEIACKSLHMSGLQQQYRALVRDALEQEMEYTHFLATCLEQELHTKHEKRQQTLLRQAKFPVPKTLQDFDFKQIPKLPKVKIQQLAQMTFIPRRENVVCIGKPGTGKSHIAIGLGMAAIQEGYRVRFTSVMQLIQELQSAEAEFRLPRFLKNWQKIDLVILDELGYVPLGEGGKLLFHFISQRYEQGSLIITSNLEFSRWVEVFNDPALTTALLDRLTHHSHILLFDGESFRFRESANQKNMGGGEKLTE